MTQSTSGRRRASARKAPRLNVGDRVEFTQAGVAAMEKELNGPVSQKTGTVLKSKGVLVFVQRDGRKDPSWWNELWWQRV